MSFCASLPAAAQLRPTDPTDTNVHLSGAAALFDLTTRFLRHLGTEAQDPYVGAPLTINPTGEGADTQSFQRYRAWFEGYGLTSRMSAQNEFPGDRRRTFGGVAGLGYSPTADISLGASVDQSRTHIDIVGLPQNAAIDLTQVGANAAFQSGKWSLGLAAVYGFGNIDTHRDDIGLPDTASYGVQLWGALAELSYYIGLGDMRIVPKIGMDAARVRTDPFTETGGPFAVSGSEQVSSRARIFAGAEIGRTWIVDKSLFDLSAYGRGVDIYWQDIGALQVTGIGSPVVVQGLAESRLGADAGAAATWRFSSAAKIYIAYDGRFRGNFTSHNGTIGAEFRW